jgi:hypothetical protein
MPIKKAVGVLVFSFALMGQVSPDMPGDDGYMSSTACRNIASQCYASYADQGYSSPAECFDDRTGGNCPPPAEGPNVNRSWYYYTGQIQMCYGSC